MCNTVTFIRFNMVNLLASHTTTAASWNWYKWGYRQTQYNVVTKVYKTPEKAIRLYTYITKLILILVVHSCARLYCWEFISVQTWNTISGMKPLTCHYQFIDDSQKKDLVHRSPTRAFLSCCGCYCFVARTSFLSITSLRLRIENW